MTEGSRHSRIVRIEALIFALVLMLVIFFQHQDLYAASHLNVTLTHSVALQSNPGIIYKVKFNSKESFSNLRLHIEKQVFSNSSSNYTWQEFDLTDYTVQDGQYVFSFNGISSVEMNNTIKATVYADKGSSTLFSEEDKFTVKEYVTDTLKAHQNGTTDSDKKLRTVCVDMLNFGAAAQKYFNINTSSLPNSGLTSTQKGYASQLPSSFASHYNYSAMSGSSCTIDNFILADDYNAYVNAYIKFNGTPSSDTVLEVTYKSVTDETKKITVTKDEFNYDSSIGYYVAPIYGIGSPDFSTQITVVVKKGSKQISGTYKTSVETCIRDVYAVGSASLKELLRYVMALSNSSKLYFGKSGSVTPDPTITPIPSVTPSVIPTIATGISAYKNSKYTTNMPKANIVIPSKATEQEQYAASLLQKYIGDLDGYTPSIVKDSTSQGSTFEISVGNTNRPHGTMKYSSDGSYKIKSYTNGISIIGIGKRGTIDGAVKFLSLCGGYFWLSFEDGYKTNQDHFKYSTSIEYDYERPFMFSDIDVCFGKGEDGDNKMFWLANGVNGFYATLSQTNQPYYQSYYLSLGGNYDGLQPGQAHTLLREYITVDNFDKHPDWFSVVNKERQPKQLCLTNPEVYEQIKKHAFEILQSSKYDPNAPMQILSLTQEDNAYYCECSECYKFRFEHESGKKSNKMGINDSALYLDLCNKLSADIKKAGYTNVYVDMLAYTWTLHPPVDQWGEGANQWKWMEIDDHVIVRYAAISRCYAHDCDDTSCERNKEVIEYLKGWSQLTQNGNANLWIWDYNANWRSTCGPYMNLYALAHDVQYYDSIGVSGVYLQSNDAHNRCNTEFGDLRNYLSVVLLENPNADWQTEIQFFCHEFYGESGQYIVQALDIMETQAKNHAAGPNCTYNAWYHRGHCMTYDCTVKQVFANAYPADMDAHNRMPDDQIALCEYYWNKALEAAANDTAEHQYKTGRTHVCWRYVKSALKVYEFSDTSTYRAKNKELFDDIFDTYKNEFFFIGIGGRKKAGAPYLDHTPDYWYYSNEG